ncbi:glycoside hydrolase family 3 C-terminal domain-containing protein [Bifidobacterium sp.]|jgi:beta-glucosidase|uniref:glycoside hydrolase family 3 C-terminal domain-containing protein n=1 Tax=Bifidobacterium sp. TaxID=41200 RepID=UPI0025B8C332|nr:glycoside hydrolase family 3 C-terminal domain-containing protein [Bifidobacterium sp.]MCH4209411.1 glycoside hydrolase family 3 C-terminal domain-containing protein [Bifidobacterium sp.]MCI1224989.1 glycoside hydrolase family 3 C-terminal domain-containing protein [Bifidobacterium sp.]
MSNETAVTNASQPAADTVRALSLEEKASLTSGADAWHLQGIEHAGIEGFMITDGPHGLRKALNDTSASINESAPATCFPPAAGLSSSWNPDLVRDVGKAMGEECIQEKVAVILGPGVNIKRNPLGGRCFEFWSEDPYLAGHEAAGIVEGVQSQGVGTSLKHFAANNQETDRLRVDALVSPRALREIYLPAFEYIVKTADPWTLMCAYNKINGVYASENRWLLTEVLRGEWGYDGMVMSDWGADHNRVAALNAGLNLQMPPDGTDAKVVAGVQGGALNEEQLDRMAAGVVELNAKTAPAMHRDGYHYDIAEHDDVARRAATESVVLLKNEGGLLPVSKSAHIAVIGEFARTPRYQGGGSSHITPNRLSSFLEAAALKGIDGTQLTFAPGFTLDDAPQDPALTRKAVEAATGSDIVLLFLGLPADAESEGFDRESIDLPAKQLELLDAVAAANANVAVVLSNGSVVSIAPWRDRAQAIVEGWLLGQAGGTGLADVLFGDADASGRLAQSIPLRIEDDPSMINWPGEEGHVEYGEGVYVGYRYYDSFGKEVAYPFGYGLSYTTFDISDIAATQSSGNIKTNTASVSAKVINTGGRDGYATVQVYVAPPKSKVSRPVHELKGFKKVFLKAGESATVSFDLDERAFAYWSTRLNDWHVEAGDYRIEVATSSRDIAGAAQVTLPGDGKKLPLNEWSTFGEWRVDPIGGPVIDSFMHNASSQDALALDDPAMRIFLESLPVNSLSMLVGVGSDEIISTLMSGYRKRFEAAGEVE